MKHIYSKQEIYEILKYEIISLVLKPGELITETEIAKRFNVSRTPCRDVIKQLASEELVEVYPQRGTYVTPINLDDLNQIVFLRHALEKSVLELLIKKDISEFDLSELNYIVLKQKHLLESENPDSMEFNKLDDLFHEKIFELAGMHSLWAIIEKVKSKYIRFRIMDSFVKDDILEAISVHEKMIKEIVAKNKEALKTIIYAHVYKGLDRIDELKKQYPDFVTE